MDNLENAIIGLLSELVRINSVNMTLSHGPGENELSTLIRHRLDALKLRSQIQTIAPDRNNLIAVVSGTNSAKSLLLNGHLDTVGVAGMDDPFRLRQEGDRLYGRGANDMKGSLAVMLLLAEYFTRHPPPLDILLTFVADEEDKSLGMDYLVEKWLCDISPPPLGAIFLEPTEENIGVCHKGFTWYEMEIIGRASHGSRPEEGIDAAVALDGDDVEPRQQREGLGVTLFPMAIHLLGPPFGGRSHVLGEAAHPVDGWVVAGVGKLLGQRPESFYDVLGVAGHRFREIPAGR